MKSLEYGIVFLGGLLSASMFYEGKVGYAFICIFATGVIVAISGIIEEEK
jgi:hypothetical protein